MRQWRVWYASLQPRERGNEWPLRDVNEFDGSVDWSVLAVGGRLGFLQIILCLSWCVRAARSKRDKAEIAENIEDVLYVLDKMTDVCARREPAVGEKRKRDDDSDKNGGRKKPRRSTRR